MAVCLDHPPPLPFHRECECTCTRALVRGFPCVVDDVSHAAERKDQRPRREELAELEDAVHGRVWFGRRAEHLWATAALEATSTRCVGLQT